jgi:hypothetical protein
MSKYKVVWYERYMCLGEVEAESEEDAISLANSGEVEDNDPTYLGTLDDETTAKLVEETEA